MLLSHHDLKQIDPDYLESLPPVKLLEVSVKLLEDLKEAHDRLNQTPQNSSRPSGSFALWDGSVVNEGDLDEDESQDEEQDDEEKAEQETKGKKAEESDDEAVSDGDEQPKKKAGKQKGAQGHGRQVALAVTGVEIHRAEKCAACGAELGEDAAFKAITGLYVVDIAMGEPGIQVTHVKHLYGETTCNCGHVTKTEPGRCEKETGWEVELTEWHLVGPRLVALIVCLALRMRLSRPRIQEFLNDWLQVYLSVGTINQAITAGGRAVEPIEEQLLAEVKQSELLYADETGWKENGRLKWLWVVVTSTVTLFLIGGRSWDVLADILEGYSGWLMSDGYLVYRKYAHRLRCWAHLIRKARGLSESLDQEARTFGEKVLAGLTLLIEQVYQARAGPHVDLKTAFADQLEDLQAGCEQQRDSPHTKTRQLARELLNDWEAIWTVLEHPELPLTNNRAECALRHWVIARRISYGTRTKQGSRAFTLLASVIDTCRQRSILPWPYLADVIAKRRKGHPAPPLPAVAG
ncbi:MAG: IS66 family transposase [Chloroflexota bacterium]|nr:IS66 family transposase [Chloroflexota bacterium]